MCPRLAVNSSRVHLAPQRMVIHKSIEYLLLMRRVLFKKRVDRKLALYSIASIIVWIMTTGVPPSSVRMLNTIALAISAVLIARFLCRISPRYQKLLFASALIVFGVVWYYQRQHDSYLVSFVAPDGLYYSDQVRYTDNRAFYRWIEVNDGVLEGPLNELSERHGKWTFVQDDPPELRHSWWWKGTQIDADEWQKRAGGSK